jgi:hypothetical protein
MPQSNRLASFFEEFNEKSESHWQQCEEDRPRTSSALAFGVSEETVRQATLELIRIWRNTFPLAGQSEVLTKEITLIKARLHALESAQTITAQMDSMLPAPYDVIRTIPVAIQKHPDSFVATFFDANIGASGDTEAEAFSNLREMVISTFEILEENSDGHLGIEPARQLEVLRGYIRRRE